MCHLAERVFRLAGETRRRVELHARDFEAHPGDETTKETVALAEVAAEQFDDAPGEQPKVGGVRLDGRRGEPVDQSVECARRQALEPTGPLGSSADRLDDV